MNSNTSADGDSIQSTVFLVPNIHCPSCVSHLGDSLSNLNPQPLSISHSIVNHTLTISHSTALKVEDIATAIEAAGYDVFSAISNPLSDTVTLAEMGDGEIQDFLGVFLDRALQRWKSRGDDPGEPERKLKRHLENCELCRAKQSRLSVDCEDAQASYAPSTRGDGQFVVVESSPSAELYEVSLLIEGMSCSSCVAKITEALKFKPWVKSIDVNLLTHSALLLVYGRLHTDEIVRAVTDLGYEASIERVGREDSPEVLANQPSAKDIWKAQYSIRGMTCSSCVAGITNAVRQHPWVQEIDVNLVANQARVVFEGKDHLGEILNTIERVGYEATLDEFVEVDQKAHPVPATRTVDIRVDGMYCEHCPLKVTRALQGFDKLTVEKAAILQDAVLRVSYVPEAPHFTIRHILASISASDPAFKASIHRPMSVEERSRRMQIREQRYILYRVILSVLAAVPTFVIGIVYMNLVPVSNSGSRYLMEAAVGGASRAEWALFAMATLVYFFAGDIFHRRTLKELRALWRPGSPTPILRRFYRFGSMSMLISFGTTIAYVSSIAELGIAASQTSRLRTRGGSYFDSVVFLIMFLLLGRLIEAYSKSKTGDAVRSLGELRPTEASLVVAGKESARHSAVEIKKLHVDLLDFGDVVRVLHGESPPCDGVIVEGETKFDESSLTGESVLVVKSLGDPIYSGTINKGDAVSMRISGPPGFSMLDQIIKIVREGQARRAPVERLADVVTGYFVPVVTLIAVATWIIWLSLGLSGTLPDGYRDNDIGGWAFWSLQFAIAVFVIACPCGIGLAAPTALFVGGGLAAGHGILVKGGGEAFQEASKLDCIVFDKTGTLTQGGEPKVTDHQLFAHESGLSEGAILGALRRLEEDSTHPIAKAVLGFCDAHATHSVKALQTEVIAGKGVRGSLVIGGISEETVQMLVGNEGLMADNGITLPEHVVAALDSWTRAAKSIVLVATKIFPPSAAVSPPDWALAAILAISDPPRPEAAAVISAIQQRGIHVWMISGDNPTTAQAVGAQVGIPPGNIIAGVLPEQKADRVKYLQQTLQKRVRRRLFVNKTEASHGRAIVAMVGDGINDSPALATADVGIAIGSGSDIAVSAAKFVLMTSQLTSVLTLIDLSSVVFRRIKANFLWAFVYNMAALPIAAGVLYPVKSNGSHVRLDPVWAALAMALSSISVVCSSLLLRSKLPIVGFRARKVLT